MSDSYVLVMLLAVPACGAVLGAFMPSARAARAWALAVSLATLGVALAGAARFNFHQDLTAGSPLENLTRIQKSVQLEFGSDDGLHKPLALTDLGTSFHLGADSISMWLVLLTVVLTPLAIAGSFSGIQDRVKEYYAWMLALLTAMLGVFVARDLLLFYVFFELTLVPMFFIIGIWGGPDRRRAANRFFLFTFAGSVLTLAVVIYLGLHAGPVGGSFEIDDVVSYAQSITSAQTRLWLALGLLAGFAVKIPLFPVHTWLPLAHTEAPTAGSVILAGVLLKLGTYGMLRLVIPIAFVGEGVSTGLIHFLGAMCVIGIIYGALVAWVQTDIKKLVAYSSVSHLGFCVLGLVSLNLIGLQGSVLYMINHGLSTGAMFLVVGMIYERYHTRDIAQLSGLARKMPVLAFFFVLFALSSIGLPGLNGFVSEFLTILGAFTSQKLGIAYAALAALGVIFGAVYMLHLVARVIWGPLKTPDLHDEHGPGHDGPGDIGAREIAILIPLAVAVVLLGVMPTVVISTLKWPARLALEPIGIVAAQPHDLPIVAQASHP